MTERLVDRTLRAFTDDLSSDAPVPGGGSAAAYAGALGSALAAMVARIAAKKSDDSWFADYVLEMDNLRADFLRLVDDDSAAYGGVAQAMKLPKSNDDEKRERTERIQAALLAASRVPLEVAKTSRRLLDACERGHRKVNARDGERHRRRRPHGGGRAARRVAERDDQPGLREGSRAGEGAVRGS